MDIPTAIRKIEEFFGMPLPADYVDWIQDAGAQYPAPAEVDIPSSSPWIDTVEVFYAAPPIWQILNQELESRRSGLPRTLPRQMVPIGAGHADGDNYLISLREGEVGAVYFQFHETSHPEDDFQGGLYRLADSFSQWLPRLRPIEDEGEAL